MAVKYAVVRLETEETNNSKIGIELSHRLSDLGYSGAMVGTLGDAETYLRIRRRDVEQMKEKVAREEGTK